MTLKKRIINRLNSSEILCTEYYGNRCEVCTQVNMEDLKKELREKHIRECSIVQNQFGNWIVEFKGAWAVGIYYDLNGGTKEAIKKAESFWAAFTDNLTQSTGG